MGATDLEASGTSENPAEKVAVFDLDGTITFKDSYVDFLLFCLKKNPLKIFRGGELVVYLFAHKAGFRSNHWLKEKFLGAIAGGLGGTKLESLCEAFCHKTVEQNFKPKALIELKSLRDQGYTLVLATASFSFYVERLFVALEMDYLLCSKAMVDEDGRLTGALDGHNCLGEEKARRLRLLMEKKAWVSVERAYSDDIVDLPIFKLADKALVVDPGAKTRNRAAEIGYEIVNWQ